MSSLPNLPVPPLNETLKKYLKSVKPFLNRDQLLITFELIRKFRAEEGKILQKLLEERSKSNDNWLESWWLSSAYLDNRNPLVLYSSPGYVWPRKVFANKKEQIEYTARVILGAIHCKQLIESNQMEQDKIRNDLQDMSQYTMIFGTSRIPSTDQDYMSYSKSNHIIVFHNSHAFSLDLIGDDGIVLNEQQIIDKLNDIISNSLLNHNNPVGILSTENRNTWALLYKMLIDNDKNKENLDIITNSAFIICLDSKSEIDLSDEENNQTIAMAQIIHGGGSKHNSGNRWFDKTLQFIIGKNGVNGITFEHSPTDGHPIVKIAEHIQNFIYQSEYRTKPPSHSPKTIKRLDFIFNEGLINAIKIAKKNIDKLIYGLDFCCFTFLAYGKELIKSYNLSPDSFIQMGIQLAFCRLHRTAGAQYESASTRKFLHGRTETIRSCSEESVFFSYCMLNDRLSINKKTDALINAINSHKEYALEASNGLGIDRHLLGLKKIALENNISLPELFTDKGFILSSHMRISSSQASAKENGFMCFGPVVKDGYGVCYNLRPNDIIFAISSFKDCSETSSKMFKECLERSLNEMNYILIMSEKRQNRSYTETNVKA